MKILIILAIVLLTAIIGIAVSALCVSISWHTDQDTEDEIQIEYIKNYTQSKKYKKK